LNHIGSYYQAGNIDLLKKDFYFSNKAEINFKLLFLNQKLIK